VVVDLDAARGLALALVGVDTGRCRRNAGGDV